MSSRADRLLAALKASRYWASSTRVSGNTIQGIICPFCDHESAWAYTTGGGDTGPFAINCNRKNHCGKTIATADLLQIDFSIEKEYPSTPKDPHRPAREYLKSRGLSKAIDGLLYEYWPNVRKLSTGAVMFPVICPNPGKVLNGRLLEPGNDEGKTHNSGSTLGCYWKHPNVEYHSEQPTYITEGIIDALSLIEIGLQSIAVLASGQDPRKVDLSKFGKLVMAFDNDSAGAAATKKWLLAYPGAEAIMPDSGHDWNDLLLSATKEEVKIAFQDNYKRYQVNANLALAESARIYANIYSDFFGKASGIFAHQKSTYHAYHKKRGDDRELIVERVCKCCVELVSLLRDNSNPNQPDYTLQVKIFPATQGKPPIETIATGRDLATPRGWKEFLLSNAGINFEAGAHAATAMTTKLTSSNVPEVQQLSITGYDRESNWFLFKYWAIDQAGKIHFPDSKKGELYRVNGQRYLKSANHSGDKAIKPANNGPGLAQLHKLLTGSWCERGAVGFAWMLASWLVSKIKSELNFFPFLSFHGSPSAGKSALTTILQAMQGLDTEGLPITTLSSKKGLGRSIARVSGLFTALLEDNRRDVSTFDYSIILTGYNSGPLQIQAAYSGDNRTTETQFLGSLLFVQNNEPFVTQAEKERVVSLCFDVNDLTDDTKSAFHKIAKIPKNQLARVIPAILQERRYFEESWFKEYEKVLPLFDQIHHTRIAGNHALILAFHNLFCTRFKVKFDLLPFLLEQANRKVISSSQRTYDQADRFFESLVNLDEDKCTACAFTDEEKDRLFVNLPGVEEQFRKANLHIFVSDALTQALTRHPSFVKNAVFFRFTNDPQKGKDGRPKVRRVWEFQLSKIK